MWPLPHACRATPGGPRRLIRSDQTGFFANETYCADDLGRRFRFASMSGRARGARFHPGPTAERPAERRGRGSAAHRHAVLLGLLMHGDAAAGGHAGMALAESEDRKQVADGMDVPQEHAPPRALSRAGRARGNATYRSKRDPAIPAPGIGVPDRGVASQGNAAAPPQALMRAGGMLLPRPTTRPGQQASAAGPSALPGHRAAAGTGNRRWLTKGL